MRSKLQTAEQIEEEIDTGLAIPYDWSSHHKRHMSRQDKKSSKNLRKVRKNRHNF